MKLHRKPTNGTSGPMCMEDHLYNEGWNSAIDKANKIIDEKDELVADLTKGHNRGTTRVYEQSLKIKELEGILKEMKEFLDHGNAQINSSSLFHKQLKDYFK